MSSGWWEMFFCMSFEESDQSFPLPQPKRAWRHSRIVAEHAHVIGICHEMLYPSPNVTADLIKTGRYQSLLARLKPELDHLWSWLAGDQHRHPEGAPDESRELQEIMWRIDHDYVRLYANAIAMRATVTRILRHRAAGSYISISERMMDTMLITAVEGVQVLEAVDSAISLLKLGIECHHRGVLRFCHGRTFQRIMFASVFLMKAMSVGAVSEREPEILDLQHGIITCFREAAIDSEHIASEIAGLLGRVFPAFPTAPTHPDPAAGAGACAGGSAGVEGAAPPPPMPLSTNGPSGPGALPPSLGMPGLEQADLFANWGFDPIIILSEMDDFIQATDSHGGA